MSVRIQLDKPHAHFTNLDFITGAVILSILGPETISNINVKLEGESRSRLASPLNQRGTYDSYDRDSRLEVHKVSECLSNTQSVVSSVLTSLKLLYKVATVFPSQDLLRTGGSNQSYTLPPGQHVYPFKFKVLLNKPTHLHGV